MLVKNKNKKSKFLRLQNNVGVIATTKTKNKQTKNLQIYEFYNFKENKERDETRLQKEL